MGSVQTADLRFSRDGAHLIVWDGPITCQIQILQLHFGQRLVRYVRQVALFQPYPSGSAPGVSALTLSPNKQYILAGFHDEKVRIINSLSWRELFAFDHSWGELTEMNSSDILNIYKEQDSPDGIFYEALSRPYTVPRLPLQDQAPGVGLGKVANRGVSRIEVSHDSRFAATKCLTSPRCVWIWDLVEMSLNSLLVQSGEIADLRWNPHSHNLNICSGANRLFLWSPKGASVCQVPTATSTIVTQKTSRAQAASVANARGVPGNPPVFAQSGASAAARGTTKIQLDLQVGQLRWNPNGSSFAAIDKAQLVFVYPQ